MPVNHPLTASVVCALVSIAGLSRRVPRVRPFLWALTWDSKSFPHPTLVTFVSSIRRFLLPAASIVLTNELWARGISVSTGPRPRQVGTSLFDKFPFQNSRYPKRRRQRR